MPVGTDPATQVDLAVYPFDILFPTALLSVDTVTPVDIPCGTFLDMSNPTGVLAFVFSACQALDRA